MADLIDIAELQKTFAEANQSDEPIAVSTPSGSYVLGDTTKAMSTSPKDYELEFYLPIPDGGAPAGAELVMDGRAYSQKVVAKEKFITERIGRKVRNYASTVAMAFLKFQETGESEIYTAEDLMAIYAVFDDSVIDACEKMVVTVLGVSDSMIEYITDASLMKACAQILKNNPSFFQMD